MTVKFTNNASTTVGSGLNASATSLTVASASSFPSLSGAGDYCYLTIQGSASSNREVVKATALSSNTFTIVRAQDGSSAGSWLAGDIVELRMTAALLTDVIEEATNHVVGDGGLTEKNFTAALNTKLNAIEASADVTDTANVTSSGALMDSEVTNLSQVKAFDSSDYATAAQGTTADAALPKAGGAMTGAITTNSTFDGRDVATDGTKLDTIETSATADQTDAEIRTAVEAASDSNVFTDADHTKLNAIEASADVTDTTNVTAAGAVMDSELASIADVKALDQSVVSGATPTFTTTNFTDATDKRLMTDAQETKLDSVESGATADQTDAQIRAAVEAATNSNVFTDADHSKLNAIEAAATADQSNAEIRAAVEAATDSNVFTDADHSKLNGIAPSANNYVLPSGYATESYVDTEITTLIGGAPGTLNTLNELAAAINDDSNYNSTLTTALATKVAKTSSQALSTAANAMTISGHTITLNRGDGTTDSVTVPDNNTTYSVGDGGLSQINFTSADHSKLNGIAPSANNYVLPTNLAGDDINIDTGALTGATVISDLDFNITTNTSGLVTDANASVATRTLTLANLGYTGATNANYITNNNQLTNGNSYITNSGGTTASTGNTVVKRDASGDINVRLVRSEYDTTNASIGYIMTQVNTGSNNYVRPSTPAQLRSALNVADGATNVTNTNQLTNGAGYTTNVGDITGVTVGTGLDGGGTSGTVNITLDLSEFTDMTAAVVGTQDELILLDNGAERRKLISEITLSDFNNDLGNYGGWVTSSGNTVIGTDSDIDTSGATIIDNLYMTDGVITSHGTRTLTLANLGYTGATNANLITNTNQLVNGAGYTTNTGTVTSVGLTTGAGLDGGGTVNSSGTFNITLDLSELTDMTAAVDGSVDELILLDNGAERRKRVGEITLSDFSNDLGNYGGWVTSSGNTVIGTDSDINTSGATIIDNLYMTDGVITSHGTRVLTLANLGYTGATNANYITNNNQLTNGAGYVTSSGNTVIGTDTNVDTSGSTIIDRLYMTDGVITSHATRSLSIGDLISSATTSSGKLSIGTTNTPTHQLEVYGHGIRLGIANANVYGRSETHWVQYNGGSTANNTYMRVAAVNAASIGKSIQFYTDAAERVKIDSVGDSFFGINSKTDTPTYGGVYISGDRSVGNTNSYPQLFVVHKSTNNHGIIIKELHSSGYAMQFLNSSGSQCGAIQTTNTSTGFTTSSDSRLKDNIQDADDPGSKIDALKVRQFDWKINGTHQDYGLIAQELQEIAPIAVPPAKDDETMLGVDYSALVPMLIAEIQSLRARVNALELENS